MQNYIGLRFYSAVNYLPIICYTYLSTRHPYYVFCFLRLSENWICLLNGSHNPRYYSSLPLKPLFWCMADESRSHNKGKWKMNSISVYVSCSVIQHSVHFGKRNLSCSIWWKDHFSRNERGYREIGLSK